MKEFNPPRIHQGTYRHRRRSFALKLIFGPAIISLIAASLFYLARHQ